MGKEIKHNELFGVVLSVRRRGRPSQTWRISSADGNRLSVGAGSASSLTRPFPVDPDPKNHHANVELGDCAGSLYTSRLRQRVAILDMGQRVYE